VTDVVLYFHVHQPWRLRRFPYFDIGRDRRYFDDPLNEKILRRVAERSYLPVTDLLRRAVLRTDGRFRCAFSITGTALDQMERWAPQALEGFRALVATGGAEVVSETSHHALPAFADTDEFRAQVIAHTDRLERTFGVRPVTFRNTELVFDDTVTAAAESLGFRAMLVEGADRLLGRRSPHVVRPAHGAPGLRLLYRDYRRSDDIAFRFASRAATGNPLTAAEFAASLDGLPRRSRAVCLFMDFETAGEHQGSGSGIFSFFEALPEAVLARKGLRFATPAEVAARAPRSALGAPIPCPDPVSWADQERDLTAWLGNSMQRSAHDALYALLPAVRRTGDAEILETWRRLATSDHVYYMCTKFFADGDVHTYFSPYDAPHTAFVAFMNVLDDLARRIAAHTRRGRRRTRRPGGAATPPPTRQRRGSVRQGRAGGRRMRAAGSGRKAPGAGGTR
jgi:alpha-amylase